MDIIPAELLEIIISYLDFDDLKILDQVHTELNWSIIYLYRFGRNKCIDKQEYYDTIVAERLKNYSMFKYITIEGLAVSEFIELCINEKEMIPDELYKLSKLTAIAIMNSKDMRNKVILDQVLNKIFTFKNLTHLYIPSLNIKELINIKNLTNLEYLDLTCNKDIQLPEELYELTKLNYLSISRCYIDRCGVFFENITKLTNLENLNISSNQIHYLPMGLPKMCSLRTLDISDNEIENLPHEMGKMTNLVRIDLSTNKFKEFPVQLFSLTQLTDLNLEINEMGNPPEAISRLVNLTDLSLYDNSINKIVNICKLPKLKKLWLGSNQIKSIPVEIKNLTGLEWLDLTGNPLHELPEEFFELVSLVSLKITSTDINELPVGITKLINLKNLDGNISLRTNIKMISEDLYDRLDLDI